MDITTARQMVHRDQLESFDDITEQEAVDYVRDTISLDGSVPGTIALDDQGDELTEAYRVVITHDGK